MFSTKRTYVSVAALMWAALSLSAHAQDAPLTPDQRAAYRMDRYFADPNGVGTYRALAGLGDPNADHPYRDDYVDRVPFLMRLITESRSEDWNYNGPYWRFRYNTCRVEYSEQTLRAREASLGESHPYIAQWLSVQRIVFWPCMHPRQPAWNQDQSVDDGPTPQALPPAMETDDPALARLQEQDRVYQSAAFAFYRGDKEIALAGFQRAGNDRASPHRAIGRYMIAAIHAGSRGDGPNWQPTAIVPEAQVIREINAILNDRSLQSVHLLAQKLLGWVRANTGTEQSGQAYARELLEALHAPIETLRRNEVVKTRYDAALDDLEYLDFSFSDPAWFLRAGPPEDHFVSRALMDAARTDQLAAWALMPPSPLRDTDGHAAWALFASRETARGLRNNASWYALRDFAWGLNDGRDEAWQVAARGFSEYGSPGPCDFVDELARRARTADERAAAQLGFAFYDQVRVNLTQRAFDPASMRRGFDDALTCMADFPFAQSNVWRNAAQDGLRYLMTTGRISEARRWRDATAAGLDHAPDQLFLLLAEDEDHLAALLREDGDYYFYDGATRFLNLLSSDALWRLAARSDVAHNWRALFARVAWTRSYARALPISGEHDSLMRTVNPELTAQWISPAGRQVETDDRRVLLDVLSSPALNILITPHNRRSEVGSDDQPGVTRIDTFQHSDNNWWCSWQPERHDETSEEVLLANFMPGRGAFPLESTDGFALRSELSTLERASFLIGQQDRQEQEALSQIECAPKVLSERALDWAAHPGAFGSRTQIAEALALAVRTTRWGCQRNGGHGAYSRRAYEVLHRQFADTEAARRTRSWFDCAHFSGGCPIAEPRQ